MNNEQIQEYVYKNYKSYKDKTLIITEHANHFSIKRPKRSPRHFTGKASLV